MLTGSRLHHFAIRGCVAFGLYLAVGFPVFAQAVSSDTATQPPAEKSQEQPKTDKTPVAAEAVQRAVERIGAAIEAQNDKDAAERKYKHEAEDLKAQWEQAKWAEWMVYVGWVGVGLTFLGLVMIYGTLKYTKAAAKSAAEMVIEAKSTTAAAIEATKEAKRQADFAEELPSNGLSGLTSIFSVSTKLKHPAG